MRRALFATTLALAAFAATAAPASSATYSTFEALSEGCSGGGDVCGTFPLIPSGDATYSHAAASDGTIDLAASTTGGLPILECLPAACPPGQYHAESLGLVWVDVDVPAGATTITIGADYRIDELIATSAPTIGAAAAAVTGALVLGEHADDVLCSDGSAITGSSQVVIGPETPVGPHAGEATLGCAGVGTLPAATWRVDLSLEAATTSSGGDATAGARARLVSVEVTAA